jgi:hypothetical protein
MSLQKIPTPRHAETRDIGGRCHRDLPQQCYTSCNEVTFFRIPGAQCTVDAFVIAHGKFGQYNSRHGTEGARQAS